MAKAQTPSQPAPEAPMEAREPMTAGSDVASVSIPLQIDTATYDEATEENRRMNFAQAILAARAPAEPVVHAPPAPAPQIMEQTRLEIEAGRKRVLEAEAREVERKAIHDLHKNDKWQAPAAQPIFRPGDYVPDVRKGQGHVGGNSANV